MTDVPNVNGCDLWWDGVWKQCCDAHDVAFFTPGDLSDFINANVDMAVCIAGTGHWIMAAIMFVGVMIGGAFVWKWKALKGKSLWSIITGKDW